MEARTRAGRCRMSKPATVAVPAVGGNSVVSILMTVVLPAPFGPSKPKTSPWATVRFKPSTAFKLPNRRVNPDVSKIVMVWSWVTGFRQSRDCQKPRARPASRR